MGFLCSFAEAPIGRLRHHANELRDRHCHDDPFVAVVLAGGYQEAGDEGRWNVGAGEALIHHAFESHLDRFDSRGAEVLVLPLPKGLSGSGVRGRVANPDALVRLAEHDLLAAQMSLAEQFVVSAAAPLDWPDALAADLRAIRDIPLAEWAERAGVRPETLSRGFRLAYGCTPKAYRASARARAAVSALRGSETPFAAVAQQLGYADQAHMTRAVTMLTGLTPGGWRRGSTGFNTGAGAAHRNRSEPPLERNPDA